MVSKKSPKGKKPAKRGKGKKAPAKMGAPEFQFTDEIADRICASLAIGKSLRKVVLEPGLPGLTTIYKWLREREEFAKQYARAREDQADTYADEITDIADEDPQLVEIKDARGNLTGELRVDTAFEAWRKTRIDARKWQASKLRPKKYGDKIDHTTGGEKLPPGSSDTYVLVTDIGRAEDYQQAGE